MKFMCVYKSIHKYSFSLNSVFTTSLIQLKREFYILNFFYCAKSKTFGFSLKSSLALSLSRYASTTFLRSSFEIVIKTNRYISYIWMWIETYSSTCVNCHPYRICSCSPFQQCSSKKFNNAFAVCPCPCTCIRQFSLLHVLFYIYTLKIALWRGNMILIVYTRNILSLFHPFRVFLRISMCTCELFLCIHFYMSADKNWIINERRREKKKKKNTHTHFMFGAICCTTIMLSI